MSTTMRGLDARRYEDGGNRKRQQKGYYTIEISYPDRSVSIDEHKSMGLKALQQLYRELTCVADA